MVIETSRRRLFCRYDLPLSLFDPADKVCIQRYVVPFGGFKGMSDVDFDSKKLFLIERKSIAGLLFLCISARKIVHKFKTMPLKFKINSKFGAA